MSAFFAYDVIVWDVAAQPEPMHTFPRETEAEAIVLAREIAQDGGLAVEVRRWDNLLRWCSEFPDRDWDKNCADWDEE